jgi:hypothetical protein
MYSQRLFENLAREVPIWLGRGGKKGYTDTDIDEAFERGVEHGHKTMANISQKKIVVYGLPETRHKDILESFNSKEELYDFLKRTEPDLRFKWNANDFRKLRDMSRQEFDQLEGLQSITKDRETRLHNWANSGLDIATRGPYRTQGGRTAKVPVVLEDLHPRFENIMKLARLTNP